MSRAQQPGYRGYNLPTDPLERDPDKELTDDHRRGVPIHEIQRRQSRDWKEREDANEILRDLTR